MTKCLRKDIWREIWHTKSRFISIFAIIAIGVGFFAGLGATSPDNKHTADVYFKQNNLFDVRILSTIGFDEEDVDTIRQAAGVAAVMPVHSADLMVSSQSAASVIRVHGMPLGLSPDDPAYMNQPTAIEGRLPQTSGECAIDSRATGLYNIGDTVTLSAPEGDELADTLKTSAYTVVGVVRSPYYLSEERGSTSVGNGKIGFYMLVPDSDFSTEFYTDLYLTATGRGELSAFDPSYKALVTTLQDALELTGEARVQVRYDGIMDEANAELADAKQELADGIQTQEEELADARLEIDDAKQQLADGEKELADGEREYAEQIAQAEQELAEAREKLADGQEAFDEGSAEFYEKSKEARGALIEAQKQVDLLASKRDELLQAADGYRLLLGAEQAAAGGDAQTMADLAGAMQQSPQFAPLGAVLGQMADLLSAGMPVPPAMQQGFISASSGARAELTRQTGGTFDLATLDSAAFSEQVQSAQQTIDDAYEELEEARKRLLEAEEELRDGYAELADGEREYEEGKLEGQQKINDAKAEIANAYVQIADGETKYADGKRDSDIEISDANVKIADAERDLSDFAFPEWFVQDRTDLPGYTSYQDDADRIAAIAKVFPVFFLLVAALVCLTTMTRMVEEQRTQIGTLKALGYSNASVIAKFLIYALTASFAGSAVGLSIGFQLFPRIIYNAYGIMYTLPPLIASFQWNYAIIGTLAAVLTTVCTVLFASYKELISVPAILMRPKAPKIGKRVFLERIPFVWKHLGFTQKVTMRNLMRYKKRMLMTVVGIAGCTALMLTGFGVKDSISNIVTKQFSDIFQYDMLAVFDSDISPEEKAGISTLVQESGYAEYSAVVLQESFDVLHGGKRVTSTVFVPQDPADTPNFVVLRERVGGNPLTLSDSGIILTEKTASLLGAELGDTVTLRNSIGRELPVQISGITENYAGHYVYMTPTVYQKLLGTPPSYNSLLTTLQNPDDTAAQDRFSQELLENDNILMTSFTQTMRDHFNNVMKSLNYVVLVLILSAGALAFVVLYNLTNINITERIREIATIKVLGFYDKEVSAYIYRENIILTLLGMLAGLGGGVLLHRFVIITAEVDMVMFSRNILPLSFVYAGTLTILFALVVNLVMYRKLQQVSMVESLKSVE